MSSNIRATSIADRLVVTNNRPTGFDYMRIALATTITLYHSDVTSYGMAAQFALDGSWAGVFIAQLVPMFFCLSGFLVAGSLARSRSLISFTGLRITRIFPALCAETLLSAFLLGAIFTTLPLSHYFSSGQFWPYLNSIPGDIHYYLPGIFAANPSHRVNGQLWTIPAELGCHLWIGIAFVVTLTRRRWMLMFACVLYMFARAIRDAYVHHVVPIGFTMPMEMLVVCFFAGVLLFQWRDRIPWTWQIGVPACAISLALPAIPYAIWLLPVPVSNAAVAVSNRCTG